MFDLALPEARFEHSFLAAQHELSSDERDATSPETFIALVLLLTNARAGIVPPGRVGSTEWWLVDGDEYIGRIAVRHALNDALRIEGGHIGYGVRPSRRRQGHARWMLERALPRAHALGIDPAMLTCDADNVASRRIIEHCGGVLDAEDVHDGRATLRYWLATRPR